MPNENTFILDHGVHLCDFCRCGAVVGLPFCVCHFNIVENRKRWYSVSAIFIIVSFFALFVQGLHLGIEFKGGASYTINKSSVTVEQARASVENIGIPGEVIVQKIRTTKVRIQTGALTPAESSAIEAALTSTFGVTAESIDTQLVGPSWGKEITKKALYGLVAC